MSNNKVGNSEQQMIERRKDKIQDLIDKGIDPYPISFDERTFIGDYTNGFLSLPSYKFAGRIVGKRIFRDMVFIDIEDSTGKVEIHFSNESIEPENFELIESLSLGDLIGVTGYPSINKRNEDNLIADSNVILLAKALRDPPDKVHGLNDDEFRFRHREVEMMSDKKTRDLFILRSKVITEIRRYLESDGFIEVETPILQPIYGGATARPFVTYYNALGKEFYLRISSELYLKRYMVGGMDKVFHIGKCFRNEGISSTHSPEFTMVEFFQSCVDDEHMTKLTRKLFTKLFNEFAPNLVKKKARLDIDLPYVDWPLSRRNKDNDNISNAWEMYIDDIEIASGASDLNDPKEQRKRFLEGSAVKVDDFTEANPYDENYIKSLEYGLMPIAGVGIGIDRLMMILTGKKNIREVIAFPAMK